MPLGVPQGGKRLGHVFEIHAAGTGHGPAFAPSRLVSGGSGRYVPVRVHPDLATAVGVLREGGFRVLAAHLAPPAVDFRAPDSTRGDTTSSGVMTPFRRRR